MPRKKKKLERYFLAQGTFPLSLIPPGGIPQRYPREVIVIAEDSKGEIFNCDLWSLVEAKCKVMREALQSVPIDDLLVSVTIRGSHEIHKPQTYLAKNPNEKASED